MPLASQARSRPSVSLALPFSGGFPGTAACCAAGRAPMYRMIPLPALDAGATSMRAQGKNGTVTVSVMGSQYSSGLRIWKVIACLMVSLYTSQRFKEVSLVRNPLASRCLPRFGRRKFLRTSSSSRPSLADEWQLGNTGCQHP